MEASRLVCRTKTIGITGPRGFIARHIARQLSGRDDSVRVLEADRDTFNDPARLAEFVARCDVILHLAGQNRGEDNEVYQANRELTNRLVTALRTTHSSPHVLFASSTQRERDAAYGRAKRDCELDLALWAEAADAPLTILVIPNVYGAGCRPFYNSVVATFCQQLVDGQTPRVDAGPKIDFLWVNQLAEQVSRLATTESAPRAKVELLQPTASLTVCELKQILDEFHHAQQAEGLIPDISTTLRASLYTTYLSYLPVEAHCRRPVVHADNRGELFEIIKLVDGGQVFFSSTKPGVIRGNHYHTRKAEWFCVVKGEASIRLRRIGSEEVQEIRVSGSRPQFVSIPVLYTHCIENIGTEELLTMFWCNEIFDQSDPDTYYEDVAVGQEPVQANLPATQAA